MTAEKYELKREDENGNEYFINLEVTYSRSKYEPMTWNSPEVPSELEIVGIEDENGNNFELTEKEMKACYHYFENKYTEFDVHLDGDDYDN